MSTPVDPETIGIIVLAAGRSSRFGDDKRLARLSNGQTLLEATLSSVPDTFRHKLLVLKENDETLASEFSDSWQICFAEEATSGMAHSLASGISVAAQWQGALVALGDMPDISPPTYSAIQKALSNHDIVIPCVGERQGNPVAFRQQYFDEIRELRGDQGARTLLAKYSDSSYRLETGDDGIFRDVDHPQMLT